MEVAKEVTAAPIALSLSRSTALIKETISTKVSLSASAESRIASIRASSVAIAALKDSVFDLRSLATVSMFACNAVSAA